MPRASKRQRNEPARVYPADAPSSSGREHRAIDHTAEIQDELLLKVFAELARIGPVLPPEEEAAVTCHWPFRTVELPGEPHPGLRAYPFLGQVCKRWKRILQHPASLQTLFSEVCIDFGHEVITAVHTPIAWSDRRPSDDEFRDSFAGTTLSAQKIVNFVRQRQAAVRKLTLMNSEGYWSDEGDFVDLQRKHTFTMVHLGMLLGALQFQLEELRIQHCNDLFGGGSSQSLAANGAFSAISCLPLLRRLAIEDLHCRIEKGALSELSSMTQLEELAITAEDTLGSWSEWAALTSLRKLELRGHSMLLVLPRFLADLPALRHLDVGCCRHLQLEGVGSLTRLEVLSLQLEGVGSLTRLEVLSLQLESIVSLMQLEVLPPKGPALPQRRQHLEGVSFPPAELQKGKSPPRSVQGLSLQEVDRPQQQLQGGPPPPLRRQCPALGALTNLTGLNLSNNAFTSVPTCLAKLTKLAFLDLSGNLDLQVTAPLTTLNALRALHVVDFRGVHIEAQIPYWSEGKCVTMEQIAKFNKQLRRKSPHTRVLMDKE
eukprot:jgi/Astpho2/3742/Aster-x1169